MNVVVLIADIVRSRDIQARHHFQRKLKDTLTAINKTSRQSLLSPMTLTIGDEFQAVYGAVDTMLFDLIEVMTAIHPNRVRVAIGHGPLSTDINRRAALEMDGRAFNDARKLMDTMKQNSKTAIQITTSEPLDLRLVNVCLTLLANAIDEWRINTIQIFKYLLQKRETDEMGEMLEITRRAVNKNIANHHLKDHVALVRALTEEMCQKLHIGSRS